MGIKKISGALLVYALLFVGFILSSIFYIRLDLTHDHLFTLSAYTKEVISNLDSEVKISWYRSSTLKQLTPAVRHIEDLLKEYHEASKDKVTYSIINPDIPANSDAAEALGFSPRQISLSDNDSNAVKDVYSGLLIEHARKHRIIPFLSDQETLEYDLTRLIIELKDSSTGISTEPNSVIILYGMKDSQDLYPYVEPWIAYAGYTIDKPALPVAKLDPSEPLLVIGSESFDQTTISSIDTFLASGGNAVFFVSGNTINVSGDWQAKPKNQDSLLSTLSLYGISIEPDLLLDVNNFRITMPSIDNSKYEYINYPFWIIANAQNEREKIISGSSQLQFFWPSYIYLDTKTDNTLTDIVSSSAGSLIMEKPYNTDPFGKQLSLFSESKKNAPEHLVVTSTKKGRIAVIADEYFLSKMIEYTGSDTNLNFVVNCVEWISGKDKLLSLKRVNTTTAVITESDTALISDYFAQGRIVNLALIPGCIIILSVFSYFYRKRKR